MKTKEFRSNDGIEKYVALLSGHAFRIGKDWTEIPEFAWIDCYANDCISKDMIENTATSVVNQTVLDSITKVATRKNDIRGIIKRWYSDNKRDKFTVDGNPHLRELASELGYRPQRGEVDEVWNELKEELK